MNDSLEEYHIFAIRDATGPQFVAWSPTLGDAAHMIRAMLLQGDTRVFQLPRAPGPMR